MGWYFAMRFKGIVKAEYRSILKDIALYGKWKESPNEVFRFIGDECYNASCIPVSGPFAKWKSYSPWAGCDEQGKEFANQYDEQTGLWVFGAVFRQNTFLEVYFIGYLLPYAFEKVLYLESWCELDDHPVNLTDICNEDMEDRKAHYLDMSNGYPEWINKDVHPI